MPSKKSNGKRLATRNARLDEFKRTVTEENNDDEAERFKKRKIDFNGSPATTADKSPSTTIDRSSTIAKDESAPSTSGSLTTTSSFTSPSVNSTSLHNDLSDASHTESHLYVSLTSQPLSPTSVLSHLRSSFAGANLLFLGTTRLNSTPTSTDRVAHLKYTSYAPLALKTMLSIAYEMKRKHGLVGIVIVHRLGVVKVGEESIIVGVSAGHRPEAWKAGEEALEECKRRVEVWKKEVFEGGEEEWRANQIAGMVTEGKSQEKRYGEK